MGTTQECLALTPELTELIATRFHVLAEPARLHILDALRGGDHTVGELVSATGRGTANVSKHLQLLHAAGFVTRRKEGQHVRYALSNADVFRLCEIVSGQLAAEVRLRHLALVGH